MMKQTVNQQALLQSPFVLLIHYITPDSPTPYVVGSIRRVHNLDPLDTHWTRSAPALSPSFTVFPLPLFFTQALFSRLPGSCLTLSLASCLLLHIHNVSLSSYCFSLNKISFGSTCSCRFPTQTRDLVIADKIVFECVSIFMCACGF